MPSRPPALPEGWVGGRALPPQPPVLRHLRGVPHLPLGVGGSRSPCPRVGNKSEKEVRRGLGLAHREWWAASGQGCAQQTGAWGLLLQTDLYRSL